MKVTGFFLDPEDVKGYKELIVIGTPTMEAKRMDFVNAMLVELAYVDKTCKNEIVDQD